MKFTQILALTVISGAFGMIHGASPNTGSSETPDKTGMHAALALGFAGFNGTSSGGTIYSVPAGKRLVIENVSTYCFTSAAEKVYRAYVYTTVGGVGVTHNLIPTYSGSDSIGFNTNVANWSGRLYADTGSVQVGALKSGTLMSNYTCYYTISGYLISVP